MALEEKIMNPVELKLSKKEDVCICGDEVFPLETGVMFSGERYGFNLTTELAGKTTTNTYPTQCTVVGVQLVDGFLNVYENHKIFPWKFNADTGELVGVAVFSEISRSDMSYLATEHNITDDEGLKKVNEGPMLRLRK